MNQESGQKLGFDLNSLDLLLDSFSKSVADPACERPALYSAINGKIVACTESQASAILVKNRKGQIRVAHHAGWDKLPPKTGEELKQRVHDVFDSRRPPGAVSLTHSNAFMGISAPQNGLTFLYVLVRSKQDNELAGHVFSDLASEIASQIEVFENQRAADQKPKSALELTHLAQLVQNLGKSNNLNQMSFHLVNDLAKITKADRVTYVANSGKIKAVSGVSRVSFRTAVARLLSKVARMAVNSGGPIEWTGGEISVDGSRTPRGLAQLIHELPSFAGFAIPVVSAGRACGVLLLEFFAEENESEVERRELVNEAINFASPVMERVIQIDSIPAIGTLDLVFNRFLLKPVRVLITSVLFVAALLGLLYLLLGVQRPFEIYGEGTLQTVNNQHVFAQIEGEIDQLLVEEGSFLQPDQRLVVISSEDLEKELITIEGEIEEAKQELNNLRLADFEDQVNDQSSVDDTKTASDIERLKIRLKTLDARLAFFEEKKSDLVVHAPAAGQVTTTNLRQRLNGRPINRGDLLMTISDTEGDWEIELEIPDNRIEFVKQAQRENENVPLEVVFRLASDSQKTYRGSLTRLDYRSDERPDSESSVVLAYVDIDEAELGESLRLGTRVYGKIDCGERNNFFLLTYEAHNKIRQWLFH